MEELSISQLETLEEIQNPNSDEEEALSFKIYLQNYFSEHHSGKLLDRDQIVSIISQNILLEYL